MRKAFSRAAATLALTSALAGCNLAPQYRQPVAPVSATYPEAATGTRSAAEIGWRENSSPTNS